MLMNAPTSMLAMEGFDPMTMMPMPLSESAPAEFSHMMQPVLESDHRSDYDADLYGSGSEMPMRPNPLKRTLSQYDDAAVYSDVGSNDGANSIVDPFPQPDISLDRDNKLLMFSMPTFNYALLDYTYRRVPISLTAQLHGMFFLAEPVWSSTGDLISAPRELTCYRRNLFSISGQVQLPRSLRYVLTDQGEQIPIESQELELSAVESVENNAVKIISVPWKTPAGAGPPPEEKPEREPSSIPLDLMTGAEIDPEMANIPVSWKRLQFRIATANNGRRKELQQHFTVKLRIVATLFNGQRVSLCECHSGPIIVRGRSPRNFQAKREIPVGTGSISGRKGPLHRSNSNVEHTRPPTSAAIVKQELTSHLSYDPNVLLSPDYFDFKLPTQNGHGGAMTSTPIHDFPAPPPLLHEYANSSPDYSRKPVPRSVPAPMKLSLDNAESLKRLSPDSAVNSAVNTPVQAKRPRLSSMNQRPSSFTLPSSMGDNDETADQLYEYFPLGPDDWSEPVDAVYRPHVVHHIKVPDPNRKGEIAKSRRYFSSESPAVGG
ncbi:MAG: hypothetical protein Q9162_003551 [Coniocarpon cinnabarinum]